MTTIINQLLGKQAELGLKHGDVAKQLGWSDAKFNRIKKGKQPVYMYELESWANVLGCEIERSLKPTPST